MTFILATTARNAACDAIVDLLDVGSGANGILNIHVGSQPANPQTALTGALLATLNFTAKATNAFGAAAAGVATAAAIASDTNVVASGTAGWARVYDSNGAGSDPTNAQFDMEIAQGSGTLDFDNITFVLGGTATITSMTITVPAS